MSQPPPIPAEIETVAPGKISGAARFLGALLVVPLFVLAVLTLWVPAFSLVIGSFQHSSDGAADGGHWANVMGFTMATAVVRLLACIIPILFANWCCSRSSPCFRLWSWIVSACGRDGGRGVQGVAGVQGIFWY